MKIGYLTTQDFYAVELLKRLKAELVKDEFLIWLSGENAPAMDLEVLIADGAVNADQLEGLSKLGLIQLASAGYESVDVEAATKNGIWVASAPTTKTGNGESVAEFAVLLMLSASRRLNEELAWTRTSSKARSGKPEVNLALNGKTVCIVGLGGIGNFLVERLRGFGMVLTGVDDHPQNAPAEVRAYGTHQLKEALSAADYVVLAVPGTRENENLINEEVLRAMKKGAVLVNVARGILIDEPALLGALRSGHLYGAGLDVVKDEPVMSVNPLLTAPRIIVTPHIAGSTDLMLLGTTKYLGEVLTKYMEGIRPEGLVNEPTRPRWLCVRKVPLLPRTTLALDKRIVSWEKVTDRHKSSVGAGIQQAFVATRLHAIRSEH